MNWSKEELENLAASDDLHIAPYRQDMETTGTLTWIWSVVVDGNLYARAYNGKASRWYKSAMSQKAGRITAAGMDRIVEFEPIEGWINDLIDGAYQTKYGSSQYLRSMIGDRARQATVKITPRD
jgi:hypothetical protein